MNSSIIKYFKYFKYPLATLLVDQVHVQKPILVVATDQMPDHILSRE